MAFPSTPLDGLIEIYVDGDWEDITDDVLLRENGQISISRGRRDEGDKTDPSAMDLQVNNAGGQYSPRNPLSPLYGLIGRNTPVRMSVNEGAAYLYVQGGTGNTGVTTPDASALDITGDIDVRIDARLDNWVTSGSLLAVDLIGKFTTTSNQRSWFMQARDGRPYFEWSANGTATLSAHCSVEPPIPPGRRQAWRITLDVSNGSGGYTVAFYYAATLSGSWTLLEEVVTTSGTTSIFNSTSQVRIGGATNIAFLKPLGEFYGAEIRNGIGGSAVANPDFTAQTVAAASFADAAGRTWTVASGSALTNRRTRFVGEIPAWPSEWDVTGNDVWVDMTAAGIGRRLGQGQSALSSTLRRGLTAATSTVPPVAYWPCEDSERAESISSGVGGLPMSIAGTPNLAGFSGFLASDPIPVMGDACFYGRIAAYAITGQTQVRWLLAVPSGGATVGQPIIRFITTGSIVRWELVYGTGGSLRLFGYSPDGGATVDSGAISYAVNGQLLRITIGLTQSGGNVNWEFATMSAVTGAGFVTSGTANSQTVGRVTTIWAAPDRGLTNTAIGHISLQTSVTSIYDLADETRGWLREPAGSRIARLCAENGITAAVTGTGTLMGEQLPATLSTLIQDAADADHGVLTELRTQLGYGYGVRQGRYNQPVSLALDYAQGHISPPFKPLDDDSELTNDVTVSRSSGGSARAEKTSGPNSVLAPPLGAGRYDAPVTLNLARDLHCADQAGWLLHLGAWDEARYPTLTIDLGANPDLIEEVAALDSGDRITIANLPPWLPPGLADLIIDGYSETIDSFRWLWTANLSPARPWDVALYGTGRYGTAGSQLNSSATSSATSLSVATTSGPRWTTDAGEMPFDIVIGGERMTVTAISGTSSPQTFTVTRSVNGVVKAHGSAAPVELFQPAIRAL
ncbi:hypothetical protein [Herbidospora daliensis]|uniref:hypothetical protein n=1 Tax=Herbidospora daliensis TaxID=295585 RepID=UPI000783410A|nr:hypothetical protein [Herbidospora daliensis]